MSENNHLDVNYWKAYAITLQYENQMLYTHISDLYSKLIESKETIIAVSDVKEDTISIDKEKLNIPQIKSKQLSNSRITKEFKVITNTKHSDINNIIDKSTINNDSESTSSEISKKLMLEYGNRWKNILNMESIITLNYNREYHSAPVSYWPIFPL